MRTSPITSPASLGRVLRESRNRAGLTQEQLSAMLGVSERYIVELEQGKPTKALDRLFDYMRETGVTLRGELRDG